MQQLQSVAGVSPEKIHPHNLRHLFARTYYQTTSDVVGLSDILGHSSLNVTRIYTSGTEEAYLKDLNRMTAKTLKI
jgi:site-specific recombinase XerD